MPTCPVCKSELVEVGFPDEIGFQHYKCPNECEFDTPLLWRIQNYILIAGWLVTIAIGLLVVLPLWCLVSIFEKIKKVKGVIV